MEKYMEIEFLPDGNVKLEMFGATGPGCENDTKEMQESIGEVKNRQYKPTYYETNQTLTKNLCG